MRGRLNRNSVSRAGHARRRLAQMLISVAPCLVWGSWTTAADTILLPPLPLPAQPNDSAAERNPILVVRPVVNAHRVPSEVGDSHEGSERSRRSATEVQGPLPGSVKSVGIDLPIEGSGLTTEGPVSLSFSDDLHWSISLSDETASTADSTTTGGKVSRPPVSKWATQRAVTNSNSDKPTTHTASQSSPAAVRPWKESAIVTAAPELSVGKKTILVPLGDTSDIDAIPSSAENASPPLMTPSGDGRLVNGARPKVEVSRAPVAVARSASELGSLSAPGGRSEPVVQDQPSPPVGAPPTSVMPSFDSAVVLATMAGESVELQKTEVSTLKVDGRIRQVRVENGSICTAVAGGPSAVQLIGVGTGSTRMIISAEDSDGNPVRIAYEVRVVESRPKTVNGQALTASTVATLTHSIRTAFPDSAVQVSAQAGRIVVEGQCASDHSARQILRMIRAACPVAVDDKLTIR